MPEIGVPGLNNRSVVFNANPTYNTRTDAVGTGGVEVRVPSDAKKYGEPGESELKPDTTPDA